MTTNNSLNIPNLTTAGKALLDDATAADQRTTLGLGTAATNNTGDFDTAGAAAAAQAASQPLDASLTAFAALVTAANKFLTFSGADTPVASSITAVALTLVAQATQALMRTTGLGFTTVGDALAIASDAAAGRTAITAAKSGSNTDITKVVLDQTGLTIKSADPNYTLVIGSGETLTITSGLSFLVHSVDRIIDLSGNLTVSSGNAATVTTNANLTGPITSVGNATSIANDVALPGAPTAATAAAGTNTTQIASTAFARQEALTPAAAWIPKVVATTFNGATAIDASLGNVFKGSCTANFTLSAPTNPTNGQKIEVCGLPTGNYTVAHNAIFAAGIAGLPTNVVSGVRFFYVYEYCSTDTLWYCQVGA